MDYELAKRLKDVGFQQKKFGVHDITSEPICYEPTLEELIEACGEELMLTQSPKRDNVWVASKPDPSKNVWAEDYKPFFGHGDTPSEAVANLWLVLKDK